MKRLIAVILTFALCLGFCCSCKKDKDTDTEVVDSDIEEIEDTPELTPEMLAAMEPQEIQIKNICQLATLEVYFHNVAKAVKPKASGIMGWGQVDRRFWIEYSGTATIGIDMNRVTMSIEDNVITVRIPHAQLIGNVNVDSSSYDINSVVSETEDWYNRPNDITAEDITAAIRDANAYTELSLQDNVSLMSNAEHRATVLIRNYIEQLSKYSDVEYTINFEYIDEPQG